MLRLARLPPRIRCLQPSGRSLVSSALLSRAWQSETIAELRNEAKLRGLSAKGSKAVLASRIEDFEKNRAFPGIRSASTTQAIPTPDPPPAIPGNPELPPASKKTVFDVKIPDLSQPEPQEPVQVPYLPDFWNSSAPNVDSVREEPQPKLLVIAGVDTHHGGGPSHNLLDLGSSGPSEVAATTENPTKSTRTGGLLDDILEDFNLPPAKEIKESLYRIL